MYLTQRMARGPESILRGLKTAWPTTTFVGIPPMEDFYISGASEEFSQPIFKMNFPDLGSRSHLDVCPNPPLSSARFEKPQS